MNKSVLGPLGSFSLVTSFFVLCCSSSPTTSAPAATGPTELKYLAWYNVPTEIPTTQATLDAFDKDNPNIHMSLVSQDYATYDDNLKALSDANTLPDTAMMTETQVVKWAIEGKLTDMSSLYTADTQPLPQLAFTYQNRPVAYSEANEVIIIYYNRQAFDDAKLPYPPADAADAWTWDQFVAVAKKLTKDKNGLTPNDVGFDPTNIVTYGGDFNRRSWIWPVMGVSNGGGVISEDGKTLLLAQQETIDAAQAIADLYLVDHVAESVDAWTTDIGTLDQQFLSGRFAMVTSGQWEMGLSLGKAILDHPNFYGVGVLPKFKTAVTYNTGGVNVMFNSTTKPDAAMSFLRWMSLEENNLSLIQGGLWMPIQKKWYTDDALMRTWADNANHPAFAEYKTAVIDYAINNAKQVPWYYFSGYDLIDAILAGDLMKQIWDGKKTAAAAFADDILPAVLPIFNANKQ